MTFNQHTLSYGICNLSAVPGRAEPSDKSEMITQLLFGEHFEVIDSHDSWILIKTAHDGYQCWIDSKQYLEIGQASYNALRVAPKAFAADVVQVITGNNNNTVIPVLLGSVLPYYSNNQFKLEGTSYQYDGKTMVSENANLRDKVLEIAGMYLNTPYLWGGRCPFGIDCSGFTQIVYKMNGINLPRDAWQQAEQGTTLSFVEEAKPGDIAYFDNKEGRITHVGIIYNSQEIIHASGMVRIDKLDHEGIYNRDTGKYTHRLRLIKKIIET